MGSLHEKNPSMWVETTPVSSYPSLPGPIDTDVAGAGAGAGIAGLTAAALVDQQGRRVVVWRPVAWPQGPPAIRRRS